MLPAIGPSPIRVKGLPDAAGAERGWNATTQDIAANRERERHLPVDGCDGLAETVDDAAAADDHAGLGGEYEKSRVGSGRSAKLWQRGVNKLAVRALALDTLGLASLQTPFQKIRAQLRALDTPPPPPLDRFLDTCIGINELGFIDVAAFEAVCRMQDQFAQHRAAARRLLRQRTARTAEAAGLDRSLSSTDQQVLSLSKQGWQEYKEFDEAVTHEYWRQNKTATVATLWGNVCSKQATVA